MRVELGTAVIPSAQVLDEMKADKQLRLPIRQLPHRMRVPHFLEQR